MRKGLKITFCILVWLYLAFDIWAGYPLDEFYLMFDNIMQLFFWIYWIIDIVLYCWLSSFMVKWINENITLQKSCLK